MKEDTTVIPFRHANSIDDPLTEIAREGARRMLAEALRAEADAFVASFADEALPDGRQRTWVCILERLLWETPQITFESPNLECRLSP